MGNGRLAGEVAVISGALGDIGRAIAVALSSAGAAVALGDIMAPHGAEVMLKPLFPTGARVRYDQTDVRDAGAVARWLDTVTAMLGTPTLIIPNAAVVTLKPVLEVSPEEWERELQVNLTGAFLLAREAARRLVVAGQAGRIIFIGSWAAEAPHTGLPAYSVSKAGLRMLMRCLALDLAAHRVLVNEVAPGYVDAGLSGRIFAENPAIRATAEATVPVHTLITAEEVARQVVWLCDPDNQQMTGSVLLMDGGLSLITPGRRGM